MASPPESKFGYGPPLENFGYATAVLAYVNSNILILLQMKQSLKHYPKELEAPTTY
jgi:hypothetical protein